MNPQLILEVKDYRSDTAWRWVLSDAEGRFLADHEVKLDPADPLYRGFADLPGYLRYHRDVRPEEESRAAHLGRRARPQGVDGRAW